MLSVSTISEIANYLDGLSKTEMERLFILFNQESRLYPPDSNLTVRKMVNTLVELMKSSKIKGPYTNSFARDMLRFVVERHHRKKLAQARRDVFAREVNADQDFEKEYPFLINSLRRDGYLIKNGQVIKQLPDEIVEAQSETELVRLLDKFNFNTTKSHFQQAIANHTTGLLSAANGQFRTFIESLLIEISGKILPNNPCATAAAAIALLAQSANPPFLKTGLNEVGSNKKEPGFVEALYKRLHPEGSHPGISDQDDCTFRYHLSVVVAHYLLRRLETWTPAIPGK